MDSQIPQAPANTAVPGTLNYIEGPATLNGQPVNQHSVGNAILERDQGISTTTGHAEVLLTPGVYLRLGPDSAAQMISPDLTDTSVKITHGHAAVEVDQLFKQNDIHIVVSDVPVQLIKPGLYAFNANRNSVLVFSGEAVVARSNGKWTTIKKGHQLSHTEVASTAIRASSIFAALTAAMSMVVSWRLCWLVGSTVVAALPADTVNWCEPVQTTSGRNGISQKQKRGERFCRRPFFLIEFLDRNLGALLLPSAPRAMRRDKNTGTLPGTPGTNQ